MSWLKKRKTGHIKVTTEAKLNVDSEVSTETRVQSRGQNSVGERDYRHERHALRSKQKIPQKEDETATRKKEVIPGNLDRHSLMNMRQFSH